MKTTSAPAPSLTGRRLREPAQASARDWKITFALCLGVASLVLMLLLIWL